MKSRKTFKKLYQPSVPDGWQLLEFANFVELSKKKYSPSISKIRCLELEHIEQDTGRLLGWVDSSEQLSAKNSFKKGNVLFGKLRPYLKKYWLATFDGVCSSEIWVFLAKSLWCTDEFLFRLIQQHRFIQVANVSSGTKMPRADWSYVSSFPFIIPPIPEQKAIAKVLGLMDEAIGNVQKTIAQKKLQKKYLMQTLLTGKKRLRGFTDEWRTVHISDVAQEVSKKNKGNKSLTVLSCTKHAGLVPSLEYFGRQIFSRDLSTYKVVPKNHFAYATNHIEEGSIGYQRTFDDALISPMYIVFKTAESIDDRFFFALLKSHYCIHQFGARMEGTIDRRGGLRWDAFSIIKIRIPEHAEQKAIANVLEIADWEISLFQTKAELLKLQKKWLMQQLLTGKRRLSI